MTHPHCEMSELLDDYVDDALDPTMTTLLEAHLARCDACERRLAEAAQARVLRFELAEEIAADLAAETAPHVVPLRQRWRDAVAPLAAAAALALMVVGPSLSPRSIETGPSAMTPSTLAQLDLPACEGIAWNADLPEEPVCAEAVTLALASFPEDGGFDGLVDAEPEMCQPDDGGDLACMPDDAPYSG